MAFTIPTIGFRLSPEEAGGMPDFQNAIQQGFKTFKSGQEAAYTPKNLAEGLLSAQLANKLNTVKAKYAEPMAQMGLQRGQSELELNPLRQKLLQSKIDASERQSQLPFGGKIPPGAIGQSMWLQGIKSQFGEDSEQFQSAKEAYDFEREKSKNLNDYRQALIKGAPKKGLTGVAKLYNELDEIEQGVLPGSNGQIQLDPEEQEDMRNAYHAKITKERSDVDTRKRLNFAENIDKTFDNIDVNALTQYGGLQGNISKKLNEGLAVTGKESKAYRDYQKSLVGAQTLAKQVRQFYGDSITPQIQEGLKQLTNPASWTNNPRIAKQNFEQFKKILKSETQTYRNAAGQTNKPDADFDSGEVITKQIGNDSYVYHHGGWHLLGQ